MTDQQPEPEPDERTPREQLAAAIQAFANDDLGEPTVIVGALLTYEVILYDDDGQVRSAMRYALPMEAQSMSSALGLAKAGTILVAADMGLYDGSSGDED